MKNQDYIGKKVIVVAGKEQLRNLFIKRIPTGAQGVIEYMDGAGVGVKFKTSPHVWSFNKSMLRFTNMKKIS